MTIDAEKLKTFLLKQIGKPYRLGVENRLGDIDAEAWDCSELVESAFFYVGVKITDGAANQYKACVPVGKPQFGDLGFLRNLDSGIIIHVGICLDDKTVVHAKGTNFGVVQQDLKQWSTQKMFAGWRRYEPLKIV